MNISRSIVFWLSRKPWCIGIMTWAVGRWMNRSEEGRHLLHFYHLEDLAKVAYARDDFEKTERLARELLDTAKAYPDDWNYGNAIHHGHRFLGQTALMRNDLAAAKSELIQSAQTPGSPQLNSFGPNMHLARLLIERGEKDVVVEYLGMCRSFWKMHPERIDRWIADVETGRVPEFGPNINY